MNWPVTSLPFAQAGSMMPWTRAVKTSAPSSQWDEPDSPSRPASELVSGLEATWQVMQAALARFTPADLQQSIQKERRGKSYTFTRGWVVWHVIEHDLHHGGEIAYSLGMYGLKAPNI
jgi:uncharacterized damage-inducible protein DinB